MAVKIVNNMGVISIENEIIETVAAMTVLDCYGVAGLAERDSKKSWAMLSPDDDFSKAINVKVSDNALNINIHIIVDYGSNIQSVGDNAIEAVKRKVSLITGVKVNEVGVFVEGVAMS